MPDNIVAYYHGYGIAIERSPTWANPYRCTYPIYDGEKKRHSGWTSIETSKLMIDVMLRLGIWKEIQRGGC